MLEIRRFEEITQIRMCPNISSRLRYWVSAYLIDGLLIDTGSSYTASELAEYLKNDKIEQMVNTHHHEDHVGGNGLLQRTFQAPLYAHPLSIPLIKNPPHFPEYRKKVWGSPRSSLPQPVPAEIKTSRHTFQVLETPGHCEGHICLVECTKGWVFSGDLYIGRKFRTVGPENNVAQMIASMNKLCQLPMERLILLTSLRTIEQNGRIRLLSCVNRLNELISLAIEMRTQGSSVDQIVDVLFGGESVFDKLTGGLYSSRRMVEQLLECSPDVIDVSS